MAVETARGVLLLVPTLWQALVQLLVYLVVEVLVCVHFIPDYCSCGQARRWLKPLVPALQAALLIIWPLRALLELAISVTHISDEELPPRTQAQQEGIEALVEAAQEEGFLAQDEAQMIEQVVEFSDKRVLELMTPRPEIVAISADATIEQMRRLLVETKFSRLVVYQRNARRRARHRPRPGPAANSRGRSAAPQGAGKLCGPCSSCPRQSSVRNCSKRCSRRKQQMAIAVDEHGLVAGVVTLEDLVEEIVGEMGREENRVARDIVREADGSVVLRGSVSVEKVAGPIRDRVLARRRQSRRRPWRDCSISVAGHVPRAGEQIDCNGVRFEVVEANQRKVLRLRVRRRAAAAPVTRERIPQLPATSRASRNAAAAAIPPVITV